MAWLGVHTVPTLHVSATSEGNKQQHCLQVLPQKAKQPCGSSLLIPSALVSKGGMQLGDISVESEGGATWDSILVSRSHTGCQLKKQWGKVVKALHLKSSETVCLAYIGPHRLLISRQGEPCFQSAASQQPVQPRTETPTPISANHQPLESAGEGICNGRTVSLPSFILPSLAPTTGDALPAL